MYKKSQVRVDFIYIMFSAYIMYTRFTYIENKWPFVYKNFILHIELRLSLSVMQTCSANEFTCDRAALNNNN